MPARTLRFRPRAVDDLAEIHAYTVETWSLDKADDYLRMINRRLRAAATGDVPLRVMDDEFNFVVVGQHIAFVRRSGEDDLDVVRVLHRMMDVARHIERDRRDRS